MENSRHNHPAQPDIVLYKETRAVIRQNIAVTEVETRGVSGLVDRVVGEGEKVGNIPALKQVARRHNRSKKRLTAGPGEACTEQEGMIGLTSEFDWNLTKSL